MLTLDILDERARLGSRGGSPVSSPHPSAPSRYPPLPPPHTKIMKFPSYHKHSLTHSILVRCLGRLPTHAAAYALAVILCCAVVVPFYASAVACGCRSMLVLCCMRVSIDGGLRHHPAPLLPRRHLPFTDVTNNLFPPQLKLVHRRPLQPHVLPAHVWSTAGPRRRVSIPAPA